MQTTVSNEFLFKNIIIWRHADAYPLSTLQDKKMQDKNDLERALSPKGRRQAKRMADWLSKRLPKDSLLVTGPALRAFQTAQALNMQINVYEHLKPSAVLKEVLAILTQLQTSTSPPKNIVLIGHQPWLWQLIAHLTEFSAPDIDVKKGAIWWLRLKISPENTSEIKKAENNATNHDYSQYYSIVAVQNPSLLD